MSEVKANPFEFLDAESIANIIGGAKKERDDREAARSSGGNYIPTGYLQAGASTLRIFLDPARKLMRRVKTYKLSNPYRRVMDPRFFDGAPDGAGTVFPKEVIEQIGSPGEVYEHPASDFVYHFLGDSNRLHIGEDQHVLFRPHEVSLSRHEIEDHHAAEVRDIRPLGATTRVTLKVEGQSELIEVEVVKDHDSLTDLARGETLFFKPKVWQKA